MLGIFVELHKGISLISAGRGEQGEFSSLPHQRKRLGHGMGVSIPQLAQMQSLPQWFFWAILGGTSSHPRTSLCHPKPLYGRQMRALAKSPG